MPRRRKILRTRAIRLDQNSEHPLYLLGLTGTQIHQIAEISRVSRNDAGKLIGYQRPEVKKHVAEIAEYLDKEEQLLFPNALILALSSGVKFTRSRGPKVTDGSIAGILEITVPKNGDPKPGWIVDGQQRALALSKSKRMDLPVPIAAFVADTIELQRDQFLRINNTRPLPRGLVTELLPEVSTLLPPKLAARKIPSAVCNMLNTEEASPFFGLIKRSSGGKAAKKRAVISDNSIIRMIEESLSSPSGCLFPYRNIATGETDFEGIWAILVTYWTAVRETWPNAWGKPASKSRLLHGAGIRALGRLMDRIMPTIPLTSVDAAFRAQEELALIKDQCHWTSGAWEELGGLRYNEIQNVPRHIRLLSSVLIRNYVQARQLVSV